MMRDMSSSKASPQETRVPFFLSSFNLATPSPPQLHENLRSKLNKSLVILEKVQGRMSQPDVMYSCGCCGFPLNLSSSSAGTAAISSEASSPSNHQKPPKNGEKNGEISFASVDLSRFTQVDEVPCFSLAWGLRRRPRTKLLCRKCGAPLGYGYGEPPVLCSSFDPAASSSSSYSVPEEYLIKVQAIRPSERAQ